MNSTFDLSGDPLSLANIRACAEASRQAYLQPTITESGESVLIQQVGTAACPATAVIPAVRSDSCLVIAFPGTHDLRDVLRDLDCVRVRATILGRPCSVHAGFARSHEALLPKIINACAGQVLSPCPQTDVVTPSPRGPRFAERTSLVGKPTGGGLGKPLGRGEGDSDNFKPKSPSEITAIDSIPASPPRPPVPIFLTGHSKGAAVAKRCALALLEQNIPVHAVITFGEPRGGDSRYAAIYRDVLGQRTLRITNAADPVPWLPAWLAGNRHCAPEAWLPPDSNPQPTTLNPQLIYGPRLWWKLALNFREIYQAWQLKQLTPLSDHHIDNYLRRLIAP